MTGTTRWREPYQEVSQFHQLAGPADLAGLMRTLRPVADRLRRSRPGSWPPSTAFPSQVTGPDSDLTVRPGTCRRPYRCAQPQTSGHTQRAGQPQQYDARGAPLKR